MLRNVWATQGKVQVLSRRQERMARELKAVFLSAPMDWRCTYSTGSGVPPGVVRCRPVQ